MIKYPNDQFFKSLDKSLQNMCILFDKVCDIEVLAVSGLRSTEKNTEVGGVANSAHLKGLALDIACTDSPTRFKIIFGAMACGFKRIGIGNDHIHLDCDTSKPQNLIFYDGYVPNWQDIAKERAE